MKAYLFTATIFGAIAYQKCGKAAAAAVPAVPSCVQTRIDALKKAPRQNPAAQVDEYRYKGKRVFLFNAPCCDQYSQAVDADCNAVCAPSGGLTGKGDGRCKDFSDSARFVKTVWKDE